MRYIHRNEWLAYGFLVVAALAVSLPLFPYRWHTFLHIAGAVVPRRGRTALRGLQPSATSGGAVLVTTNLPFDEWTEVYGSERLTGALLDRLTHHVHILELTQTSGLPA